MRPANYAARLLWLWPSSNGHNGAVTRHWADRCVRLVFGYRCIASGRPDQTEMFKVPEDNRPRTTKNVYFYKSGDQRFQGVRLPVNWRRYKTIDTLLDDLNQKIPDLPFGVRDLATVHGRHHVTQLSQLEHLGSYVCAGKKQRRLMGIDLDKISGANDFKFRGAFLVPKSYTSSQTTKTTKASDSSQNSGSQQDRFIESPTGRRYPILKPKSRSLSPRKRKPKPKLDPILLEFSDDQLYRPIGKPKLSVNGSTKSTIDLDSSGASIRSREAFSEPEWSSSTARRRKKKPKVNELSLSTNSLSPLDSKKLKHVQRNRLVTKQVNKIRDSYTLPPMSPVGGRPKRRKSKSPKKSKVPSYDQEQHNAATKIQANFRGYRTRKALGKTEEMKEEEDKSQKEEENQNEEQQEREKTPSTAPVHSPTPERPTTTDSRQRTTDSKSVVPVTTEAEPTPGKSSRSHANRRVTPKCSISGTEYSSSVSEVVVEFEVDYSLLCAVVLLLAFIVVLIIILVVCMSHFRTNNPTIDYDMIQAATKIQAGFRGYKVRKQSKIDRNQPAEQKAEAADAEDNVSEMNENEAESEAEANNEEEQEEAEPSEAGNEEFTESVAEVSEKGAENTENSEKTEEDSGDLADIDSDPAEKNPKRRKRRRVKHDDLLSFCSGASGFTDSLDSVDEIIINDIIDDSLS